MGRAGVQCGAPLSQAASTQEPEGPLEGGGQKQVAVTALGWGRGRVLRLDTASEGAAPRDSVVLGGCGWPALL